MQAPTAEAATPSLPFRYRLARGTELPRRKTSSPSGVDVPHRVLARAALDRCGAGEPGVRGCKTGRGRPARLCNKP